MDISFNTWVRPEYVAPALGIVVAGLGGALTEIRPWYKALKTPRWKPPDWALVETVFLWASILWMIIVTYPLSATASLLLLPYLIWVSIASVLNLKTVTVNGPFK